MRLDEFHSFSERGSNQDGFVDILQVLGCFEPCCTEIDQNPVESYAKVLSVILVNSGLDFQAFSCAIPDAMNEWSLQGCCHVPLYLCVNLASCQLGH